MATPEEEQAKLNYELAVYKEQVALIKRETERISLTTIDLSNALTTVENFKKKGEEKPMLVPIGGGAMIKGSMSDTKILVPIGAEYLMEMEREDAIKELQKRIDATKKAVEKLTSEFNKIAEKLRETTGHLKKLQTESKLSERVDENIREDYI